MRAQRFITGVAILFTVASITAQKSNFKTKEGPQPDQCSMSTHRHHYSDLRMVPVKVSDVDSCGFNYVDLEQNTIGSDHYLRFDNNFSFAEIGNNGRVEKFVAGLDRWKKSRSKRRVRYRDLLRGMPRGNCVEGTEVTRGGPVNDRPAPHFPQIAIP